MGIVNIPEEAVEAAARALYGKQYLELDEADHAELSEQLETVLHAAAPFIAAQALESVYPMIRDMVDPEECWFDHHGGCQAHGYLSLQPGNKCPHAEAKEWLKAQDANREAGN